MRKSGGGVESFSGKLVTPQRITADATGVYWADTYGRLSKRAFDGLQPILLADQFEGFANLALDESHVYSTGSNAARVPKTGGAIEILAPATSGPGAWCTAVDETQVFWTEYRSGVFRAPKTGGEATRVAPAGSERCLAVDPSGVYWMDDSLGALRAPKNGGTVETVSSVGGTAVALDAFHVFWSGPDGVFRTVRP